MQIFVEDFCVGNQIGLKSHATNKLIKILIRYVILSPFSPCYLLWEFSLAFPLQGAPFLWAPLKTSTRPPFYWAFLSEV